MDSQDLLSVDGGVGQQWEPLQPTSTPKGKGVGSHLDDPLVHQYMHPGLIDPQFDPYMPTTIQAQMEVVVQDSLHHLAFTLCLMSNGSI